jgi:hypothetical protein
MNLSGCQCKPADDPRIRGHGHTHEQFVELFHALPRA